MQMRMVKEWNRFVLQPNTGVILQNHAQNTRKPKRCEENQEAGDHHGQPVAAPTELWQPPWANRGGDRLG